MKTDNLLRVTVPKLVREALGLQRGTTLAFEVIDETCMKIINLDRALTKRAPHEYLP